MQNYKFPILDSSGNPTSTVVDMEDMFVRKDLFNEGGLFACGFNINGQVGDGTTTNYYDNPKQIGFLTNWKQVTGGLFAGTSFAIKTDGTLWAWGKNNAGQLGNGTRTSYSSPIQIGSLTNWKQISCGINGHVTAIKTDGTLWAWGDNYAGQLGNGTITSYSSPIQIGSLTNWKEVSCGYAQSWAIKTDGTLWAWGEGTHGVLGNNTLISYSSPIQIGSLTDWKQVSSGKRSVFAIKTDGTLWSWGSNGLGQLGNGTTTSYSSPIQIGSLTNWKQISCGYYHTAAIKTDGTLWAWGKNNSGQLGNGTTTNYSSPIQIGSLTNWKQVSCGYDNTSIIKTDGTLWTCGYGSYNIYGSSPIQVGSVNIWKQIYSGSSLALAITKG